MSRTERGYSLIEVVVAMAIFGTFLFITAQLTRELSGHEKRLPLNFLSHPQVSAVLSRLRRDVGDATSPYYVDSYATYTQSPSTLILYSLQPSGFAQTIVWDFSTAGEAHRRAFSVGNPTSHWMARGVPQLTIADYPVDGHHDSVRITAKDNHGQIAIDQIFQPRAHE